MYPPHCRELLSYNYQRCLFVAIFQHGLVLGVYRDGDRYTLTEEANKFNDRLGGRLDELLKW